MSDKFIKYYEQEFLRRSEAFDRIIGKWFLELSAMTLGEALEGQKLPCTVEHNDWGEVTIASVHENFAECTMGAGYGLHLDGWRRVRDTEITKKIEAPTPHACKCDLVSLLQRGCSCGGI